jgi:hypothetical protein
MDENNTYILSASTARAKLLLDANVLSYSQRALEETGIDLLDLLDSLHGTVDWFVGSRVAVDLYNNGVLPGVLKNLLNCDYPDMKMNEFPYEKKDGSLAFTKLNTVSGDDWAQICLAYNHPELIIVTNDSRMFKSAHAVLRGRAIALHDFLQQLSPYWLYDKNWLSLKAWFNTNIHPLRNNSSWILPGEKYPHGRDPQF